MICLNNVIREGGSIMASNFKEELYWENYLEHHGVKGMKWGVRRSKQELGYPMTRREAKKAIRNAKRAYRKETGTWHTTGKNVAKVDKLKRRALENDKEYQDASKKYKQTMDKVKKHEANIQKANDTKDHLTRLQTDPTVSRDMRRRVEQQYLKEKKQASKSRDRIELLEIEAAELDDIKSSRAAVIGNKYRDKYADAVVKDLGIKDVKAGREMLDRYGLTNKALNYNWTRSNDDYVE